MIKKNFNIWLNNTRELSVEMVIFDRSESQNRDDLFLLRPNGENNYKLKYKPFNSYYAKTKKDQQV